jgi:tRNA(fMet)-specific endonuclease VapC
MIYLLDTDTLIFMIRGLKAGPRQRGQRERATKLVERCQEEQKAGHEIGISAITVSELEYGARNSSSYDDEIAAVQKILVPFQLYDYDATRCPLHFGRLRYELEGKGQPIGAMDLLIAAHALSLEATLVSNNLGHFGRVAGLMVANWTLPR